MRISDWSSDVCSSDLNEVVKFALRMRASNDGRNPSWTSYEKIREVIEKRMFSQVEDLLPVISFGSKKDGETATKHDERSEESRVGKAGVSTCRCRGSRDHGKKKRIR